MPNSTKSRHLLIVERSNGLPQDIFAEKAGWDARGAARGADYLRIIKKLGGRRGKQVKIFMRRSSKLAKIFLVESGMKPSLS
jgi:hypothetical protein